MALLIDVIACRFAASKSSAPRSAIAAAVLSRSARPITFTRSRSVRCDAASAASPIHSVPPGRRMAPFTAVKPCCHVRAVDLQADAAAFKWSTSQDSISDRVRLGSREGKLWPAITYILASMCPPESVSDSEYILAASAAAIAVESIRSARFPATRSVAS